MALRPFTAFPKTLTGTDATGSYDARTDPRYMGRYQQRLPPQNDPSVADTMRDESIMPAWFKTWQGENPGGMGGKDEGFGWNKGTADLVSSGFGGLGNLARGWAAIKGLGIAEDQLEENKRQYNQNYAQQLRAFEGDRTRANTRISDQNAWKTAQGRTDLGSLIV